MKRAAAFVLAVAVGGCSAPAAPSPSSSAVTDGSVVAPVSAPPHQSTAPQPETAELETAAPIGSTGPDARCNDPTGVEKIEILQGATTRAPRTGVAVTYRDVRLTFQGIMEDGTLTPSAYSWQPSAGASSSWQNLGGMPICVRVVSSVPAKMTLELSRRPR